MKTNTKFLLSCALATVSLSFTAACPDGTTEGDCTSDLDCPTDGATICNVPLGTCVEPCDLEPTADPCAEGEVCNADKYCEAAEGEGEACPAGDDECLDTDELCSDTDVCDDPDTVEGGCPAATEFSGARAADGPVIYDVELEADADFDDACEAAVTGTTGYTLFFLYSDSTGDFIVDEGDLFDAVTWAEDGQSPLVTTLPISVGANDDGSSGGVLGVICFVTAPTEVAVQAEDAAGNASNVACGPVL